MKRIKEKPPIKSRQKERTGTPVARGVSVSAQRAFRQYKESVRDAAEEGQSPEDYGGQAISDHTLSAPAQTARAGYALAKQYARKAREKKDAEPPEECLRNEGSEPLLSQKKTPKQPQIKEKGTYIHAQPTQMEQRPGTETVNHHAMERGRKLAENRAQTQKELRKEASAATAEGNIESDRPIRPNRAQQDRSLGSQGRYPEQGCRKQNIREKCSSDSFHPRNHLPNAQSSFNTKAPKESGLRFSPRPAPKTSAVQHLPSPSFTQTRMQAVLLRQKRSFHSAGTAVRKAVKAVQAGTKSVKSMGTILAIGGAGFAVVIILLVVLFGGLLNMTGGDNAVAAAPVSAEVQAYEPTIQLYAVQYGIPEYVELIKAVMMQESGGRGLDPMQAAEGGYNTRYPHVPNGITDPDYSIQCGIQELRDSLNRAGVQSPMDMEHIKLALQGYNYGPGYITWAVSHYGGYSLVNAAEFSDMQAAKLGWRRYGDKEYVPHVLRYYAFGRLPGIGGGGVPMIQIALSQEGSGGQTYWSWYGFNSRVAWCACFASWCADQAGLIDAGLVPRFSLCSDGVAWFHSRGRFMDASYIPAPGDLIFFDWGHDGSINHVGIVTSVSDGKVYTIEGNSTDKVRQNDYSLNSSSIYGYGVVG